MYVSIVTDYCIHRFYAVVVVFFFVRPLQIIVIQMQLVILKDNELCRDHQQVIPLLYTAFRHLIKLREKPASKCQGKEMLILKTLYILSKSKLFIYGMKVNQFSYTCDARCFIFIWKILSRSSLFFIILIFTSNHQVHFH